MTTPMGYNFGDLYGRADHSVSSPLEQPYHDAVVTGCEWGRTKDGTKGAWTIKFKTTTGERPGTSITMTMSVNPVKQDGTDNDKGMGIMFRQLAAMGVPVPPPEGPPGTPGFWQLGWTEDQVARFTIGKPVYLNTFNEEYQDRIRTKVSDILPPRPGAPTEVQLPQQAQAPQAYQGAYPAQQGYAQAAPQPNGYPQQPPAPQPQGYPVQQAVPAPQGPVAPGPWQNAQPPAGAPQPQPIPGAPSWAQPAVPGQGGQGEFTAQGQSFQGYPGQPDPYQQATGQPQPPVPQPQFQPPQPPPQQPQQAWQGAPATPAPAPAVQFQPGAPSPSYPPNGQGQQPQQPAPQQPQGAPEPPPWA